MGRAVIVAAIFILVYLICYLAVEYLSIWGDLLQWKPGIAGR